jgi:hypothetical protein
MEPATLNDRSVVKAQLRRDPRGAFDVQVRCSFQYPQVIRVAPLVGGKPFPTLYWLTCPFLRSQIGTIEANGWIKRLEKRLAEEPDLRAALQRAHQRYIRQRHTLLAKGIAHQDLPPEMQQSLERGGIGGILDWTRLKCLHLHVAHAMADENPVGEIVLSMLDAHECPKEKVICSAQAS